VPVESCTATLVTLGAVVGVEAFSTTWRENLSDSIAAAAANDWNLTWGIGTKRGGGGNSHPPEQIAPRNFMFEGQGAVVATCGLPSGWV
jgi:hypothetical protein